MDRERLRDVMRMRGMTQRTLADASQVTKETINNYINGKRGAYFEILADLCRALNISADYLLGLTDEMVELDKGV